MLTQKLTEGVNSLQNGMYLYLNNPAKINLTYARFLAIPISLVDTILDTIKLPIHIIEDVSLVAINIFGAALHESCSLNDAVCHTGLLVFCAISLPVQLIIAPGKIFYQMYFS